MHFTLLNSHCSLLIFWNASSMLIPFFEALGCQVILRGMTRIRPFLPFIVVLTIAAATSSSAQSSRIDLAFQKFWGTKSPAEAAKLIGEITKSAVTFDEAVQRLKRGRQYTAQKSGVVMQSNKEN